MGSVWTWGFYSWDLDSTWIMVEGSQALGGRNGGSAVLNRELGQIGNDCKGSKATKEKG